MSDLTAGVIQEIHLERHLQDQKWGEQNHPDGTDKTFKDIADEARVVADMSAKQNRLTWFKILNEEVMEAFAEEDPKKLRAELIQVAAVAVAWIEAIDRRNK